MQNRQTPHAALPRPLHDENARQDFVMNFRRYLSRSIAPGAFGAYHKRVEPALEASLGRKPETADEIRPGMLRDPIYQLWSAMQRQSQEMVWDSVIDTIERSLPEMQEQASKGGALGSLRLAGDDFEIPRYHSVYDIHLQPGGYHGEVGRDDVSAGLIYDMGVPIYSVGMMGKENASTGQTIVNYVRSAHPDFRPLRILDLGCAIGNSTLRWAQAFPEAEVHGIDVGAGCLRHAHVRANALGVEAHFSQQNAEAMDFADGSFDLIVSALLFHETSRSAVPNILKECARLLAPGGMMVHFDGFRTEAIDPLRAFFGEWEIYNNNERFLRTVHRLDWVGEVAAAGFERDRVGYEKTPFVSFEAITKPGTKGYMTGFGDVPLLVASKSPALAGGQ